MPRVVLSLGLAGSCLPLVSGCGDNAAGVFCGTGTVLRDGACHPDTDVCGPGTEYVPATNQCEPVSLGCARGTVADGDRCVPDGTVICDDGTTYNTSSGQCQADITTCGSGTVLVGVTCVPLDDAIEASITEAAEPNDTDGEAGAMDLPPLTTPQSIYGCITPVDANQDGSLDIDRDSYRLRTNGPALVDISVDGIGGLAGGFEIRSAIEFLSNDNWSRIGLNLVSDTSRREVFLPAAGDYYLDVTDSRSLLTSEPAGGSDTCYLVSVRTVTLPAAEMVTDTISGTLGSSPRFLSFAANTDGDILEDLLTMPAPTGAASLAMVHMREGRFAGNVQGGASVAAITGGLRDTSNLLIVVEPEFNFALDDVLYDYALSRSSAPEFVDGIPASIAVGNALGQQMAWTAVSAGEILRLRTSDSQLRIASLDDDLDLQTLLCDGCVDSEFFYQATESGLLYLGLEHDVAMTTFDVTFEIDRYPATPLLIDEPLTSVPLADDGFDFYETQEGPLDWTQLAATSTSFSGDLQATRYERNVRGFLEFEVPALESLALSESASRFHVAETAQSSLWRLADSAFDGTADAETYDIAHRTVVFENLLPTSATPVQLSSVALLDGEQQRYLLQGQEGDLIEVTVSTVDTLDLSVLQLDEFESIIAIEDAGGDGETETVQITVPARGYVPLLIEAGPGAGAYDLTASLVAAP